MSKLTFKGIGKTYSGEIHAVTDFNLEIQHDEFIVLVGPSGCGKSTVLRMIAGLEDITEGTLYIDNKAVNGVQPKDRDVVMVFQNYALYPHMTVYENMAFGLKIKKVPKEEIDKMVKEAAEILKISDILNRKPKALSGGQRQRVALGRALVRNPKVFLMDEPLSNLDAKLRINTRAEIVKLHNRLGTTFIYVTHDQTEAMTMGDRIVVMKKGVIQQTAPPQELYNYPANIFVAGFIGSPQMNFIDVKVVEQNQSIILKKDDIEIETHIDMAKNLKDKDYDGKTIVIGIRPEDVTIKSIGCNCDNKVRNSYLNAYVDAVENMGSDKYIYLKAGYDSITARVAQAFKVRLGDEMRVYFDKSKIHCFTKENGQRIYL